MAILVTNNSNTRMDGDSQWIDESFKQRIRTPKRTVSRKAMLRRCDRRMKKAKGARPVNNCSKASVKSVEAVHVLKSVGKSVSLM